MVLLEAEGHVQGEGCRGRRGKDGLCGSSAGRGPPAQGTGQCEHKAGSQGRAPAQARTGQWEPPVLTAEGTALGLGRPSEPKQEEKRFLNGTSRLYPPSQKVWSEVPGDHWLEDHTKWTGHPEVTGGGTGIRRRPFLPGSPRWQTGLGQATCPGRDPGEDSGSSQSFIEGRTVGSAHPAPSPYRIQHSGRLLPRAEIPKAAAGLLLGHRDSCAGGRLLLCYPLPGGHSEHELPCAHGPPARSPCTSQGRTGPDSPAPSQLTAQSWSLCLTPTDRL